MRLLIIALLLFQAVPSTSPSPDQPILSTAEVVAINSIEKDKQNLINQMQQDNLAENKIIQEFSKENPGWHLTSTFQVEKDKEVEKPKSSTVKK